MRRAESGAAAAVLMGVEGARVLIADLDHDAAVATAALPHTIADLQRHNAPDMIRAPKDIGWGMV